MLPSMDLLRAFQGVDSGVEQHAATGPHDFTERPFVNRFTSDGIQIGDVEFAQSESPNKPTGNIKWQRCPAQSTADWLVPGPRTADSADNATPLQVDYRYHLHTRQCSPPRLGPQREATHERRLLRNASQRTGCRISLGFPSSPLFISKPTHARFKL